MTLEQEKRKNEIVIKYLKQLFPNIGIKAEYSTNDNDLDTIIVQEQAGQKEVFFNNNTPLYNYYSIDIFGTSIKKIKDISVELGNLIGKMQRYDNTLNDKIEHWQIIFQQMSNPQAIEYSDIRRIGYNMTLQCVVNIVAIDTIQNKIEKKELKKNGTIFK